MGEFVTDLGKSGRPVGPAFSRSLKILIGRPSARPFACLEKSAGHRPGLLPLSKKRPAFGRPIRCPPQSGRPPAGHLTVSAKAAGLRPAYSLPPKKRPALGRPLEY